MGRAFWSKSRFWCPFMLIPSNEDKPCNAAVRHIEKHTGGTRRNIRRTERDGNGPSVDLSLRVGPREYAIEHTRLQPWETRIESGTAYKEIKRLIEERFPGRLPGGVRYELHIFDHFRIPPNRNKRRALLESLAKWIEEQSQKLHEQSPYRPWPPNHPYLCVVDGRARGAPGGIGCELELLRWPILVPPGNGRPSLRVLIVPPDDPEQTLTRCLKRAFERKCPKLGECRADWARTVLVLEGFDLPVGAYDYIGNHLPALLGECSDTPDEIYLVEPFLDSQWLLLPVKIDGLHWPDMGMPSSLSGYHEPGRSPTQGLPKWYCDALGLDGLSKPFPTGWTPSIFKEEDLKT